MKNNREGFILILTLILTSLMIIIATQVYEQATSYFVFSKMAVDREKAKALALGGIQLAISQLEIEESDEEAPAKANEKKQKQSPESQLLGRLLPVLNRWQTYELTEAHDEIDGTLQLCIMCEDGKLNLNKVYDFEKKKFVGEGQADGDMRVITERLLKNVTTTLGVKNAFELVAQFLKKQAGPLEDITQLLLIKELSTLTRRSLFYEPPTETQQDKPKERPAYLMDLFTVWTPDFTVEPWLLSDSVRALFGLKRVTPEDPKKLRDQTKEFIKKFKPSTNWQQDWNALLKPLYGQEFTSLPKGAKLLFRSKFEPTTFSVLSYGKIGAITQRLYAILVKQPAKQKEEGTSFAVKKLYWL